MKDLTLFFKIDKFLDNFKAPKTVKIYDYENDRSATLNKFLFTEEKIIIKDQKKESDIQDLEKRLHELGKSLDDVNKGMFKHIKKDMHEAGVAYVEGVNRIEKETKVKIRDVRFKEGFSNTLFKEVKYKNLNSLSNSDLEAYEELGVSLSKGILEEEIVSLKDRLDNNIITMEEYKEEYKKLEESSFITEVSESYLEPLLKTFFNKIKPNALIKDLDWLHERFIFMSEDPRRRINDKEDSSLFGSAIIYKRNYAGMKDFIPNLKEQNFSIVEGLASSLFTQAGMVVDRTFDYSNPKHKPKNGPNTIIEPIYGKGFPKERASVLLTGGVAHLFRDHPVYLLHLNHLYQDRFWIGTKENREQLATGYKTNGFSDNIVKRSKILNVRDKPIFDIQNYEEVESMNLSRDEKFDLFLKILHIIDSNPIKDRLTPNQYLNEKDSKPLNFSKASVFDVLEYFKESNEINGSKIEDSNGNIKIKRQNIVKRLETMHQPVAIGRDHHKLDLNKHFYLVHSLYSHIYKKFDFDREIQSKAILKNYWDKLVKPWLDIEESRSSFFNSVRYLIEEDLESLGSEKNRFFSEQKREVVEHIDSLFNRYSIEARKTSHFKAEIEPEILAREVIEAVQRAILKADYKIQKEIDNKYYSYDLDWKNKSAINQKDIEDVFERTNINNHYANSVKESIDEISGYYKYQMAVAGEQGKKILDASILFAIQKFSNIRLYPESMNPTDLFIKNTKIHLDYMIEKYKDPNYMLRKQAPYFPSIRHLVENWGIDLEKDELHPLYNEVKRDELIEKLGSNDVFEGKEISNKLPNLGLYNIENKHINPLNNIAYQLMQRKEKSFGCIANIDLSQDSSARELYRYHNLVKDAETYKERKASLLENFDKVVKEMIDSKIDNNLVENIIDKEKMIETMKTMVMMSKNFKNKDRIIDLSSLGDISKELGKLDEKLSGINDITKSGMILNYIFTMNELYKKNSVDKNELVVDVLDIDKSKAIVLQNLIEIQSTTQNGILNELKDNYIKEAILLNENFNTKYDNSIKDKFEGVEVLNGKHFPLFVDLDTFTIFTVEWTTRYPTLNVVVLPDVFAKLEIDNNKERRETLFGVESKVFNGDKMAYPRIEEVIKEIDADLLNEEHYKLHDLQRGNIIDRVSTIVATIQSNYMIQLEQDVDKALFVDVDPLMLEEPTPNVGAVPFMNKHDLVLLRNSSEKSFGLIDEQLQYVDRYNFKYQSLDAKDIDLTPYGAKHIYQESGIIETVMFKKVNGFPFTTLSKGIVPSAYNDVKKFESLNLVYSSEALKIDDLPEKNNLAYPIDALSRNKIGLKNKKEENMVPAFKRRFLNNPMAYKDGFADLKLFETKVELEAYKDRHNAIMSKGEKNRLRGI
ncbi:MAG: hypothetical protein WC141_04480 [Arcobacteraceae bacterium]